MHNGKQRSTFNVDVGRTDHSYGYYRCTADYVKRCVNQALLNALKIIDNMGPLSSNPRYGTVRKMGRYGNEWPTNGSFDAQNGLECVVQEMKAWNALPPLKDWMFHTTFIGLQLKRTTEFYTYEVLWSVPTPAFPEPQVTVGVFFHISVNQSYPPHFPIDVSYCFEGYQFPHPLKMIFRPKWLYDVHDMKTMMFKSFHF